MKKFISIMLVLSMVFGMSTSVFAVQSLDEHRFKAGFEAKIVEKVTGMESIDKCVAERKTCYFVDTDDLDISIPKHGSENLVIESEVFGRIGKAMPAELAGAEGIMTANGTVVFQSEGCPISMSVQVLKEMQGGIKFNSVQSAVILKNEDAPKCVSYRYELPEGYRLMTDREYGIEEGAASTNVVYVVDTDNEIVNVIEPMPAIDAEGEEVNAVYSVDGTVLTMELDIDEGSAYPIVVPLVEHPDRTKTSYMTKDQVLETRNKFKTNTIASAFEYLISVVLGFAKDMTLVGAAWGTITFMNGIYNTKQFDTWDKIYTKFQKKYVKIDATFKWHQGQRGYHPSGALKSKYVSSKP